MKKDRLTRHAKRKQEGHRDPTHKTTDSFPDINRGNRNRLVVRHPPAGQDKQQTCPQADRRVGQKGEGNHLYEWKQFVGLNPRKTACVVYQPNLDRVYRQVDKWQELKVTTKPVQYPQAGTCRKCARSCP